jgi:hypothetical protein
MNPEDSMLFVATALTAALLSPLSPQPRVKLPRKETKTVAINQLKLNLARKVFESDLKHMLELWIKYDALLRQRRWSFTVTPLNETSDLSNIALTDNNRRQVASRAAAIMTTNPFAGAARCLTDIKANFNNEITISIPPPHKTK